MAYTTPVSIQIGKPVPVCEGYHQAVQARKFWQGSYEAGYMYRVLTDAMRDPVLHMFSASENSTDYNLRVKRAVVRPYVASIVDRYVSFCFRQKPARPSNAPLWYTDFLDDADGDGYSFTNTLRDLTAEALIDRCSYLWLDTLDDGNKVRPIVHVIDADQVTWTRYVRRSVAEALLMAQDDEGQECLYHLTETNVTIYRIEPEKVAGQTSWYTVTAMIDQFDHTFGRCPLLECDPAIRFTEHVAESQKHIFNLSSSLDQALVETVYNQFVITGVDNPDKKEIYTSNSNVMTLPKGADAKYVAPPPETIEQIQSVIESEHKAIMQYAGVGQQEANNGESGLARSFRFDELNTRLVNILSTIEQVENQAIMALAAGIGETEPGKVQYPVDLQTPDFDKDLDSVLKVLASTMPKIIKQAKVEELASTHLSFDEAQQKILADQMNQTPEVDKLN